jgi:hypothetical protein
MTKTITLKAKIQVSEDVVSRQVQNEEVILNLKTGTYFGLDEVGTVIWDQIKSGKTLADILENLVGQYDSKPETIEKDLLALTQKLQKCQLIELQ